MAIPNLDLDAYVSMYQRRGWTLIRNTETTADFERLTSGYPGIGWWIGALFLPIAIASPECCKSWRVAPAVDAILRRQGYFRPIDLALDPEAL